MQKYIISPTGKEAVFLEINRVIQLINEQEVIMNNLQNPEPNNAYKHALEDITTRLYNYKTLTGRELKIDFKDYLTFLTTYVRPTPQQLQATTNRFNHKHNKQEKN